MDGQRPLVLFLVSSCFTAGFFTTCFLIKLQSLVSFFVMCDDTNFESTLRLAIKSVDLGTELPKCLECVADELNVTEEVFTEVDHQEGNDIVTVRFLRSLPTISQRTASTFGKYIFLFHDQTNDANIWRRTLQILSASGYCCVAPQLTNFDYDEEKIMDFLLKLTTHVEAREVVLVSSSMSGIYLIPFLSRGIQTADNHFKVKAMIAIGISDTHRLKEEELSKNQIPCLIIRGSFDTSIGLNAANKLKHLPNSRLFEIPDGKHLCHLSHPIKFHEAMCNFLSILSFASFQAVTYPAKGKN